MAHENDLDALLGLPLDAFIRSSYRLILAREADESGFEAALTYLKASGRRILYLHRLATSGEAQDVPAGGQDIRQLRDDVAAAIATLRTPLLGARRERARIVQAIAAAQVDGVFEPAQSFICRADRTYDLESFYQLNGAKFLRAAYVSICDRLPSPGEARADKARLRKGISKAVILSRLLRSHEGRSRGTRIAGASFLAGMDTLVEVPVLGHLLMLIVLSVNLNRALRYVRAMEYEIYASFDDEEG